MDEKCVKAAVLQGRAYVALLQYDKALECYNSAKQMDAGKDAVINECIERARIKQAAQLEEQTAQQTFEASSETGLVRVLESLVKPDQPIIFYIGGLQVIQHKLQCGDEARTLFRSSGGFQLASSHGEISRCLSCCDPGRLSVADIQLTAVYLTVLRDACVDNDENQCQLLAMYSLLQQLMKFIESVPLCQDVALAGVDLLVYLSRVTGRNRSQIVRQCGAIRLLTAAFQLAHRLPTSSLVATYQRFVCELAASDHMRRQLHHGDEFEQSVLDSFNLLLATDLTVSECSVQLMVSLCEDDWLRGRMAVNQATWSTAVNALKTLVDASLQSNVDLVCTLLTLLANMSISGTSGAAERDLVELCGLCTDLVTQFDSKQLVDVCFLLLSRVLKRSQGAVECVVDRQLISHLARLGLDCDDDNRLRQCLAVLAACTLHSDVARRQLVDSSPPLIRLLVGVLLSTRDDDQLIGNTALCLSHCLSVSSAMQQLITASSHHDLIKTLLTMARDHGNTAVQHNCAILIGKLVQQQTPFLDRLRQLHGLEILHTVLRQVQH